MQVQGKVVTFYTIAEVAKASSKSTHALRKLMERGLLPEANFRSQGIQIHTGARAGEQIMGARLYSEAIFGDLVRWLKSIKQGRKITPEMEGVIRALFASERTKITNL